MKPPQSSSSQTSSWGSEEAERHLRSLELFGMRFGLDRMRRMMTALDSPEQRFASIHVVGTNGKSSTTRMIAAILERHGLRTGTYTSPHLISYTERVQIGERDLDSDAFAAAIARAAHAAEQVNHTLAGDDHVTQFELLTAAALWAMAEREVQVAVVEAGLGGRYDATSVIDSRVTVLTNVGLEHTRWLGPTVKDIAEEKLAVLRPDTTLVLGRELAPEALAVAERVAGEQNARIVPAGGSTGDRSSADDSTGDGSSADGSPAGTPALGAERLAGSPDDIQPAASGPFQRRNFALARAAAETYLRELGIEPREDAVRRAAAETVVQGRLQVVGEDPLTVLDGAHNPDATRALIEALPEVLDAHPPGRPPRPLGLVLGVLEDKDAASMLRALLGRCERAWFTAPPSSRALSPAALQSLARQLGFDTVVCEPEPARALAEAQRWARERGAGAAVLATGSVYLVGDLLEHLRSAGEGGLGRGASTLSDLHTDSHGGR
jgi:dihydrofolate synthase / folylpolyglutamate synthase